jgi:hypothetical protein
MYLHCARNYLIPLNTFTLTKLVEMQVVKKFEASAEHNGPSSRSQRKPYDALCKGAMHSHSSL